MFTGLIARTASVVSTGAVLRIRAPGFRPGRGWSVSVDGSCLTVTRTEGGDCLFDLSRETLDRTIAGGYEGGTVVNIELPLGAGDLLHGHIVTGHVDCTGRIEGFDRVGGGAVASVSFPGAYEPLLVEKGSVAVDGISLTAASVGRGSFTVALVPLTLGATNASSWRTGTLVNIEFDIIGKYLLGDRAPRGIRPESPEPPGPGGERGTLLREYLERHGNS